MNFFIPGIIISSQPSFQSGKGNRNENFIPRLPVILGNHYFHRNRPRDSANIVNSPGDLIYSLSDSLLGILPPEMLSQIAHPEEPDPALLPLFVLLVIIFAFLLSRWIACLNRSGINRKLLKEYSGKQVPNNNWQQMFNSFYRSLTPALQQRFRKQLLLFMAAWKFHFLELNEDERIPVLISAAAVQITFDLKNYLLAYFTSIYIIQRNYHYGFNTMPLAGHVSSNGIYLSWENFKNGIPRLFRRG